MNVEIFSDINNSHVKTIWKTLEHKSGCFPQSSWAWCSAWWNQLGNGKKVRIFVLYDNDGEPVALAPFIIDSILGVSYLRSMPFNYGDYFDFLVSKNANLAVCFSLIFEKIITGCEWHSVLLVNVNIRSYVSNWIEANKLSFESKVLVKVIVADLLSVSLEDYLSKISKKRRAETRRKMRLLESEFNVDIIYSNDPSVFLNSFDEMVHVQSKRWGKNRPTRSEDYIILMRESIHRCFVDGAMALLEVRADSRLVAYRIGFVKEGVFYDWNTSYDTDYEEYSPGALSIAYLAGKLIENGVQVIDFMAGYYDYKLSFSPKSRIYENRIYVSSGSSLRSKFVSWYFLRGRDFVKQTYNKFQKILTVK